jgi:hypothetical protein
MPKLLYLFVFTHYFTQNRFVLLLEMLKKSRRRGKRRPSCGSIWVVIRPRV